MTFFQFKQFSFINCAIKRIVDKIKKNGKCFFVNLTNATFWKNTPRGQEILEFFKRMQTDSQKIEFLRLFDIFVVEFHNGMNAYVSMTADPSNPKFEKTLRVSISKGYKRFTERCSGRATPSIEGDLRGSIDSSPVQPVEFQDSSDFPQFGKGPAQHHVSQAFHGFGGPASRFSLLSEEPLSLGIFQPIAQGCSINPFTSLADFIPVQPTDEPVIRKEKLKVVKGRVIREIEIPSGCSSGQSTSSTVGIAKSPKAKTPVATTIANLEKKIARLERLNPAEGSLNHSDLRFAKAKLEKIRNSL
jgi:hypothetical protein